MKIFESISGKDQSSPKSSLGDSDVESQLTESDGVGTRTSTSVKNAKSLNLREWMSKDIIVFFLLGVLVPIPTMISTSGARIMFVGSTGISGLCTALPAAVASFTISLFVHHIPYPMRVLANALFGVISLTTCTLGSSIAGPAIGTVIAGFEYAFGSNCYLGAAAFYDQRTVIAFSIGTGMSAVVGTSIYMALMAIFHDNWHLTFWVSIPIPAIQLPLWFFVLSKEGYTLAEQTRKATVLKESGKGSENGEQSESSIDEPAGFGPGRTRLGLFFKTILPQYVLPLTLCTMGALLALEGLAPTYLELQSFKLAPEGDLNYQINFLMYGAATFLFSSYSIIRALPMIWIWAGVQWTLVTIGIIQLFVPFLTYYPAWLIFIFVIGGIVGGSNTNTCYKIAEDFRKRGEPEEVRSFAMSYGGLGNFAGDAIGGGVAILVQHLATSYLPVRNNS